MCAFGGSRKCPRTRPPEQFWLETKAAQSVRVLLPAPGGLSDNLPTRARARTGPESGLFRPAFRFYDHRRRS